VFGKAYTDNHTLTVAQMPAHTHNYNSTQTGGGQAGGWNGSDAHDGSNNYTTTSAGSNNGHSHIMDIRVQYVDLIIAEKD
jgi:microcystin-dependent protein